MEKLAAVVLAAGKGTRMKSNVPKVLHPVGGRPMLEHIIATLRTVGVDRVVVVVGYGGDQVRRAISGDILWVEQHQQLGTGHALVQAAASLTGYDGSLLVVNGDAPLLTGDSLKGLLDSHHSRNSSATVLTAQVDNPHGYGRIIRDEHNRVVGVIEEKDALAKERQINEVNSGCFCFRWADVAPLLPRLKPANAQGEYYITDIPALLNREGLSVGSYILADAIEMAGVNDRSQLAQADRVLRNRINHRLMEEGVTIVAPDCTWVDGGAKIGRDTTILPNTHILGTSVIGEECIIGPDTTIKNMRIGNHVQIRNSVLEESDVGDETTVGPYAYIRPGCRVGKGVRIGDFVELKNTRIGDSSKVPHLSYVGDAIVGASTNIGCGVITVNYDGKDKHTTRVGDNAFVGSNSNLVAPVTVADDAYVAAGSTITDDVPARALAIARCRQVNKPMWRKD